MPERPPAITQSNGHRLLDSLLFDAGLADRHHIVHLKLFHQFRKDVLRLSDSNDQVGTEFS